MLVAGCGRRTEEVPFTLTISVGDHGQITTDDYFDYDVSYAAFYAAQVLTAETAFWTYMRDMFFPASLFRTATSPNLPVRPTATQARDFLLGVNPFVYIVSIGGEPVVVDYPRPFDPLTPGEVDIYRSMFYPTAFDRNVQLSYYEWHDKNVGEVVVGAFDRGEIVTAVHARVMPGLPDYIFDGWYLIDENGEFVLEQATVFRFKRNAQGQVLDGDNKVITDENDVPIVYTLEDELNDVFFPYEHGTPIYENVPVLNEDGTPKMVPALYSRNSSLVIQMPAQDLHIKAMFVQVQVYEIHISMAMSGELDFAFWNLGVWGHLLGALVIGVDYVADDYIIVYCIHGAGYFVFYADTDEPTPDDHELVFRIFNHVTEEWEYFDDNDGWLVNAWPPNAQFFPAAQVFNAAFKAEYFPEFIMLLQAQFVHIDDLP
jgi:hypothetical protein